MTENLDKENLKPKRIKLTEEEKQQKRQEYFEKNKDKIKLKEQEWRDTNREHYNKSKQVYYHKNLGKSRHVMRMKYWRQRQKALVLGWLKKLDKLFLCYRP